MFCEARLSMDCALVKELQEGGAPPLVAQRPGVPPSTQNCERIHVGISKPQQSENTHVYTVPRLDSFWEAMVSSQPPA
jgi:hypothetical protein